MSGPGRGELLSAVRGSLVEQLGAEPDEASVTFLGMAPLTVLRFVDRGTRLVRYVSLGCSAEPMTDPTAVLPDASGPRAEVMITLRDGVDGITRALAVLAAAPAVEGVVLSAGSLLDLSEPLWPGAAFTAVVLRESGLTPPAVPGADGLVMVFEAIPVTHTEAAWARVRGVEALLAAWEEAGIDVTDPGRSSVAPR